MSGTLHYRLVLRDAEDTIDEVTLSSLPADANPFLTAPPEGDGESLDPLTGKVGFADYVFRVADLPGTLNTATVVMDEQWTYADITARNAVWAKTSDQAAPFTFAFPAAGADPAETVTGDNGGFTGSGGDVGGTIKMHVGIVYGGGIGGGGGYGKHTRMLTGLTPGGAYTVVCDRIRLSRARGPFDNCGMSVNGGGGQTNGLDGKVTVPAFADGSGNLTITLGHFDLEYGMTGMAMTFGRIRVYGPGGTVSARVITGLLADSDGRWAGVNRKASWYESTDNGSTWTLVYAGWLTQAILTGGIEWALHIGDSDRRERHISAFTTLPTAAGFSGMRLIGTPFAPSQNVAAHYPPAWRFRVEKTGATDGDLPADAVLLRFVSGWAPEHLDEPIVFRTGSINADVATAISLAAQPYLQTTGGVSTFPSLRAVVTTPAGATVGSFVPYGTGGIYLLIGDGKTVGQGGVLFDVAGLYLALQWTGTLPSVGTQYDVTVAVGAISETTPFWWQGHPVDLVAALLTEAGLAYDAASAATVKAALGALYAQYRFTKTEALWDLIERVAFGPCGFALRRNTAWEWEFFETRTIPSSEPSETIDENAMYDPERAIFDLGVDSQVTAVVWKLINWVIGNATSTDAPMDRAQAQTVTANYQGALGDATIYGDHQVVYDLPGTIVLLEGEAPAQTANIYHQSQSEIILTRWGRGVPSSEIATLRASGIDAKLGEFVVVDLDHKPTIDTGATPSGVRGGARICQVVHRTRDPAGPILQLLDVGTATTNALVPAFTLAQGTDTRHASTLTLTNSGTLTGYQVEVQVNTGASAPSGGTSLPLFAPDAVAHDLPAQLAGSTVWARARTVKDDELPGAWSAWANVALDAVPPVTGLANSAGANDTERVLTWTVGDATLPVRVRWKATADADYTNAVTLPAGSNTYTITGIVPGTAMTAAVDHLELSPFTGDSADATTTWTAGSTTPTLTAPTNPQGFTDGAGTFGLRVTASVLPSRTVFMLAVETGVGTGVYGTPVEVGNIASVAGASACVITLTRPNDGLTVQLTAHHAKTGYTDSSDTTAVTLNPWETTATVPGEATDAEYVLASAVPASLPNARQLAGESGVVSVTDGGAGSTATVGLVAGGVPLAKIAATGTPSSTTFLRGDGAWETPAGGGGGAPDDASYLTLGTASGLTNERVLTAGTGIALTDGGAGGTLTIASTITAQAAKCAIVRRTTNQSIANNTVTAITFDTEDKDTDGFWSSGAPTRLTIPEDGVYMVGGGATFATNTTGKRALYLRRGGTDYLAMQEATAGASNVRRIAVTGIEEFTAGQYIELYVYQDSGGSLDATPETEASLRFWIAKVEPGVSVGGGSGSGEGQDTGNNTIYVATTGNDTTGDGTSGNPYLTIGKAVSTLPRSIGFVQTIDVADGTYAEAIDLRGFTCTGNGLILITGNTTTPANVSVTGSVSSTVRGETLSAGILITGPVNVELEGLRVNATADHGVWAYHGARVVIDRCTVTGTLTRGIAIWHQSKVELQGNITVSGWSSRGIQISSQSQAMMSAAGTLTVTGPGTTGYGVQISSQSQFSMFSTDPSGMNITITGVQIGFQVGLNSSFTHQATSATITVDNASTPGSSAAVQCTDHSNWSTTQSVVFDHLSVAFELNSISYGEAVGGRTFTNVGSDSSASQNSVVYLP